MSHQSFWNPGALAADCSLGEFLPDWSKIPIGLPVVLAGLNQVPFGGVIDAKMENGSAVWVIADSGDRRLIHRTDGYAIRAVVRWPSKTKRHAS